MSWTRSLMIVGEAQDIKRATILAILRNRYSEPKDPQKKFDKTFWRWDESSTNAILEHDKLMREFRRTHPVPSGPGGKGTEEDLNIVQKLEAFDGEIHKTLAEPNPHFDRTPDSD